jgi:hypothetical protein
MELTLYITALFAALLAPVVSSQCAAGDILTPLQLGLTSGDVEVNCVMNDSNNGFIIGDFIKSQTVTGLTRKVPYFARYDYSVNFEFEWSSYFIFS